MTELFSKFACNMYFTEQTITVPNFEEPNEDQTKATISALCGKFTMIQGPPGVYSLFIA